MKHTSTARLDALEKYLKRAMPSLTIYFTDGTTTTADAGTAIDIIKERSATVVKVEDCRGGNGALADRHLRGGVRMSQAKRLDSLQALVDELRLRQPARMIVTLNDGRRVVTDPVGAIQLWRDGEVAQVSTERDDYAELAGVLSALSESERNNQTNQQR